MTKKKLLILLLILLASIALFVFKTKKKSIDAGGTVPSGAAASSLNNEFITALMGVKSISLDTGLLSSPVFKSLVSSGAIVDVNAAKGKNDPFSTNSASNNFIPPEEVINPKINEFMNRGGNDKLLNGVKINFSKVTSSTVAIAITGLPSDSVPSVSIVRNDGVTIIVDDFVYKSLNEEYTTIATGLTPKTDYTIKLLKPETFNNIEVKLQTK